MALTTRGTFPIPNVTSDRAVNGLYFGMQRFIYDKEQVRAAPYQLYARQSGRVGYVELWDDESSGSMHVKIIDDNTLEVFNDAKESDESDRLIYKKVANFAKNPHANRLKSARDDGTIF